MHRSQARLLHCLSRCCCHATASAMLLPVQCCRQCYRIWVRVVCKLCSIPHAKYGFFKCKASPHQLAVSDGTASPRLLQLCRCDYCMCAGRWRESGMRGVILWATWNAAPQLCQRVAWRSSALLLRSVPSWESPGNKYKSQLSGNKCRFRTAVRTQAAVRQITKNWVESSLET